MADLVTIRMNVQILVLVRKDTNVGIPLVVIVVKTSTNVQLKDINAIEMLTVLIFSADTTVYVTLVMKVMANDVQFHHYLLAISKSKVILEQYFINFIRAKRNDQMLY